MTKIDDRIRQALDDDDRAFLNDLEDGRGIWQQIRDSLGGPMKPWTIAAHLCTVIVSLIGIYAIWGFFQASGTDALIRWAALGWAAWTMQIALKQWLWDRLNMLAVLRELKRLELRVAMLIEERGQ